MAATLAILTASTSGHNKAYRIHRPYGLCYVRERRQGELGIRNMVRAGVPE